MIDSGDPELSVTPADYLANEGLSTLLNVGESVTDLESRREAIFSAVDPSNRVPVPPDAADLARLHRVIRSRKVTTVLEFGVGYSTLVMADALYKNRESYGEYVHANLRRSDAFTIHSIDADQDFIDRTRSMIPPGLQERIIFHFSGVSTSTFNGRVVTFYDQLPNICPDLIYLDGPDQFIPVGDVRGISTRHADRMAMSADILAFEHFLTPGTMILVDGRTANARLLESNLQRAWEYSHDEESDIHTFELKEMPLGRHNRAQIEYCLGREWLEDVSSSGSGQRRSLR